MVASHSSYHVHLVQINDTHKQKVATLKTYSWDVQNTHDLIDS
jgi:hypothetical protein